MSRSYSVYAPHETSHARAPFLELGGRRSSEQYHVRECGSVRRRAQGLARFIQFDDIKIEEEAPHCWGKDRLAPDVSAQAKSSVSGNRKPGAQYPEAEKQILATPITPKPRNYRGSDTRATCK